MTLRVACAYARLHPLTRESLDRFAPQHELYELGPHHDAYHTFLAQMWTEGTGWLNVEHDIELHAEVVPQLEDCAEPWCVIPYAGPGGDDEDRHLYGSLGCTRFSADLLREHPAFMADLPVRDWRRLDCEMSPRLNGLGYAQHIHWPAVLHHHVREDGRCDCRQIH